MAKAQIVRPRASCEVVPRAEAYGSCRMHGKRLQRFDQVGHVGPRRFPHLLGPASPAHRLHRPNDIRSRTEKPAKMTTQITAETNGGYQASVATLR